MVGNTNLIEFVLYAIQNIIARKEGALSHERTTQHGNSASEQTRRGRRCASRRGVAILLLLSLVQFMDVLDASILNIALPSIEDDLGFSQQSLQWVINGYILTYGGFCSSAAGWPTCSVAARCS